MKICSVEGCDKRTNSKELCSLHFQRYKKTGSTEKPIKTPFQFKKCNAIGCEGKGVRFGFCKLHLEKWNFDIKN